MSHDGRSREEGRTTREKGARAGVKAGRDDDSVIIQSLYTTEVS